VILAAFEWSGPPSFKDAFPGYLFVISTVGLAVILYLGYAAFFIGLGVLDLVGALVLWTLVRERKEVEHA